MAVVAGAVLGLAALAGCTSSPGRAAVPTTTAPPATVPVHAPVGYPSTFLAVTETPPVTRGDKLYRYATYQLQVRAASGGAVRHTLLRSLGRIAAVVAPDRSIVVAIDYGCRSTIERIAPTSSRATVLQTVPGPVSHISLDPGGTELAYLTYPPGGPHPCVPSAQPASPQPLRVTAGPSGSLENVLGVLDLATGAVTTATDMAGHPLTHPSWSPDGTRISVGYMGDTDQVLVLGASPPTFATARHLVPPAGCGFTAPTWTHSGIVAVEGCGAQGPALSPGALVRLTGDGKVQARWPLPACIDGISTSADSSRAHVLVLAFIGYGTGPPCGTPRPGENSVLVAAVHGPALDPLAHLPPAVWVRAVSW